MVRSPAPPQEAKRLEALLAYDVFGTGSEPAFDRITRSAARLFNAPMAFVTFTGERTLWVKSAIGDHQPYEVPREASFCAHTILSNEILVVQDARLDPRFAASPYVTGAPFIRFYAGCPIRTPSGHNIGTLCVVDTEPRTEVAGTFEVLKDLALSIVDQLEVRRRTVEHDSQNEVDAEMNYRRLTDAIRGMVFRVSFTSPTEFRYLYVSNGSTKLLGLSPEVFVGDRLAFISLIHADDLESFRKSSEAIWRSDEPWNWVGRIVTADGETKWIHGDGVRDRQPDGTEILEGLMIDITESKEREAASSGAMQESERANQAKSEFLSRMSHEFRTPMNAILGFAQMLEMAPLSPDFQEDLAQVKKAGQHLLGLINEVLDLSSVHANRVPFSLDSICVRDLLEETVGLLRPLLESRDVSVTLLAPEDATCVFADRHRLKQILINLMSNAVKYNRQGGNIALSIRHGEGLARLDIADEGSGIAADKVDRLFTPFDRLGAEETGIEGTGLGLTISRGLAELMGGSVSVSSEQGHGSTFTLSMPEVAPSEEPPVELNERHTPTPARTGSRSILYVEDNESNILLVYRILSSQPDLHLVVARTLASGLEMLSSSCPDLLLLDLNLPDGSGEAILRWVRTKSAFPSVPIVVLSADATPWQSKRMLSVGANHYLTKPIDVPSFRAVISEMLQDTAR